MVHRRRPLGDRVIGKFAAVDALPPRTAGTSRGSGSKPSRMRWRCVSGANGSRTPFRRQPELLQRLLIELERHRLRRVEEAHAHREVLIGLVGVLEELRFQRNVRGEERAVLDVALQLVADWPRPCPCGRRRRRESRPAGRCPAAARGARCSRHSPCRAPCRGGRRNPAASAARRDRSARSGSRARRGQARRTGQRIASCTASGSEIGRSSSEMQSWRSR